MQKAHDEMNLRASCTAQERRRSEAAPAEMIDGVQPCWAPFGLVAPTASRGWSSSGGSDETVGAVGDRGAPNQLLSAASLSLARLSRMAWARRSVIASTSQARQARQASIE